jgi:hypothetical protein
MFIFLTFELKPGASSQVLGGLEADFNYLAITWGDEDEEVVIDHRGPVLNSGRRLP